MLNSSNSKVFNQYKNQNNNKFMKEKNNNLNSLTKNKLKKEEKRDKNKGLSFNLQKLKLKKKLDFINFRFYFQYISFI
jgi:hypothetical protein